MKKSTLWSILKTTALLTIPLISQSAPPPPPPPGYNFALRFAGTYDKVTIPYNSNYSIGANGDFTLEAQIKVPSGTSAYSLPILSQRSNSTNGFLFLLYSGGTKLLLQINGVYGGNLLSSNFTSLYDGNLHTVAVTRSGSFITFFVDGNAVGTTNKSNTLATTGPLYIGYDAVDNNSFKGDIYDAKFWITARSASQTNTDYYLTPPASGLIGAWSFDGENTQSVLDHGSVGNSGYLGNDISTTTNDPIRLSTSNAREDDAFDGSIANSFTSTSPNPARSGQDIHLANVGEGTQIVHLLNETGTLMFEQQVTSEKGNALLHLQGVQPGLYFLRIGTSKPIKLLVE